jgi:DNA-binding winged helix-turn-helix (wHTH) protein/TolB-like protein
MLYFGDFTLDPASGELRTGSRLIELRPKTAELLELLARAGASRVVTRDEIRLRLWPTTVIDYDTGINTCVRQLREALGDPADEPQFIQTIPRRGYRFLVSVTSEMAGPPAPAAPLAIPAPKRPVVLAIASAAVVVAGLVGWRAVATDPSPIVAVATMHTRGTVSEDYLATRVVSDLSAALSSARGRAIRVRPWVPGMRYDPTAHRVEYRGEATDVGFLVSGFIFEENGTVEISIELRDVSSGADWWSRNFARAAGPPDTIAADVARQAAASMAEALLPTKAPARAAR